jgi:capsid protein
MALLKGLKRIKRMCRPVYRNNVRKAMVVVLVNESRCATDFLKSRSRICEYSSTLAQFRLALL